MEKNGYVPHDLSTRGTPPKMTIHSALLAQLDGAPRGNHHLSRRAWGNVSTNHLGNIDYAFIGRSQFGEDPYFDGMIDDLRIYNRALSAEEIHDFTGS